MLRDNYNDEIRTLKLEEYKPNKRAYLENLKENLRILEAEYKIILSEKIKELSTCSNVKRNFIENTYKSLEEEKYREIEKTKKQILELNQENLKVKEKKLKQNIDYFNQVIENKNPNKAILSMLIDKIYIYQDKSVKFELKADIDKMANIKK